MHADLRSVDLMNHKMVWLQFWLLVIIINILGIESLDLDSVRQNVQSTVVSYQARNTTYFEKDLDLKFMPLCGNSRLDNRNDYEVYYANKGYGDVLQVPRGRIGMVAAEDASQVGVKIIVDEVCDDGNRRDGDGCSADCLSLDKIDSSCEIAVNWTSGSVVYEEIAFKNENGGPPYVAVANGIYRLDVNSTLNQAMQPVLLASKSFHVHAMIIFENIMYIYSAEEHAVYTMATTTGQQTIQKICTLIGVNPSTEPGLFYIHESKVYLACKDLSSAFLIKVNAASCLVDSTMISPPSQPFSLLFYIRQDASCVGLILKGKLGYQNPHLLLCPGMSPVYSEGIQNNPSISDKPWEQSMFVALATSQIPGFQGNSYSNVILLNSSSHDITAQIDSGNTALLNTLFIYSQFYIVQTLPTIRNKYLGGNLIGDEPIFIGDPLIYSALKSTHNYACGRGSCVLDFFTNYNILSQNPNAQITSTDTSFYTILKRLFSRSNATSWEDSKNVNDTIALYESELGNYGFAPNNRKRTLTNTATGSSWVIDGARLVEISRHGASYEVSPGKCVPASLGMCPPCFMYQVTGPCIPCGPFVNTLEWNLQCRLCPPAAGRRLLGGQLLMVAFVLRNTNATELRSLFSQAQIEVADGGSYTVKIYTAEPVTIMKSIELAALSHPNWKIDVSPRIVYSISSANDPSTSTKEDGTSNTDIPIWVWGIVGGLVLLSFIMCGLYYTYEQNYQRHNPKYKEMTKP